MIQISTEEAREHVFNLAQILTIKFGLDIVELVIKSHKEEIMIQLLVDKPEGGISIEQCTDINKGLVEAINEAAKLPAEHFSVEVASPGLDRPLKTSKDFLRNLNYNIKLFLKVQVQGKKEAVGVLKTVNTHELCLTTKKKQDVVIELDIIEYGILIF